MPSGMTLRSIGKALLRNHFYNPKDSHSLDLVHTEVGQQYILHWLVLRLCSLAFSLCSLGLYFLSKMQHMGLPLRLYCLGTPGKMSSDSGHQRDLSMLHQLRLLVPSLLMLQLRPKFLVLQCSHDFSTYPLCLRRPGPSLGSQAGHLGEHVTVTHSIIPLGQ